MEVKRITMNQRSHELTLSHLLTFAMETEQSTESGGVITLKPKAELPKLEYLQACLTGILTACANAQPPFTPYKRADIADMLDGISYHLRNSIEGPTMHG